jgi:hypothetical protein
MSKEKNKNTFRVAALLLVACLISSVMLSGTFAKYTSEYAGRDTALVARWDFTSDSITGGTAEVPINLDLFQHTLPHVNSSFIEEDDTYYIIAPGVSGEFVIEMDYIADVDADVTIDITELDGNAEVPMEYSVDGGETWIILADLPEELATNIIGDGKGTESNPATPGVFRIAAVDHGSITPVEISETVQWRWAYDRDDLDSPVAYNALDDEDDTDLGEASQLAAVADHTLRTKYGIQVTLTATQVQPTP